MRVCLSFEIKTHLGPRTQNLRKSSWFMEIFEHEVSLVNNVMRYIKVCGGKRRDARVTPEKVRRNKSPIDQALRHADSVLDLVNCGAYFSKSIYTAAYELHLRFTMQKRQQLTYIWQNGTKGVLWGVLLPIKPTYEHSLKHTCEWAQRCIIIAPE